MDIKQKIRGLIEKYICWEEFVYNGAKQFSYSIPNKVLMGLVKRWAFFDKSYKVNDIKKDIDNEKFLSWVLSFDKNDHAKYPKNDCEIKPWPRAQEVRCRIAGSAACSRSSN